MEEAYLEIALLRCPKCGNFIIEPSWFADLEQDIQCAVCGKFFNSKRHVKDKVMLKFWIENNKIKRVEVVVDEKAG